MVGSSPVGGGAYRSFGEEHLTHFGDQKKASRISRYSTYAGIFQAQSKTGAKDPTLKLVHTGHGRTESVAEGRKEGMESHGSSGCGG